MKERAAQCAIPSLMLEYRLRFFPANLAVGAPRSPPVFARFVASELVPTPLVLLLGRVALAQSPAEDGNSLQ